MNKFHVFVILIVGTYLVQADDPGIINNRTDPGIPNVTEVNRPTISEPPTPTPSPVPSTTTPSSNGSSTTVTTPKLPSSSTTITTTTTTTTTTSTIKPPPTAAPEVSTTEAPQHQRKFDGPSFVGGIILALGLVAIGFVAFKFYKARTEMNYHTL